MPPSDRHRELRQLLELYCENQISPDQHARLESLASTDDESLQVYLDYIDLHGSLIWDLAAEDKTKSGPSAVIAKTAPVRPAKQRRVGLTATVTACAAIVVVSLFVAMGNPDGGDALVKSTKPGKVLHPEEPKTPRHVRPLELGPIVKNEQPEPSVGVEQQPAPALAPALATKPLSDSEIIVAINDELARSWREAEIEPSETAGQNAWMRRTYLDILGRIPTIEELQTTRSQRGGREAVVAQLLDDPAYARFWSTKWTNLLIGRSSERGVNRPAFEKFMRDQFAYNRPWNETVGDLISAEGTTDENGATNFLVAHLNSQAVPATAVTARVFLGIQVQCTQCHDHPFNDNLQDQFWTLNSFFKQTRRQRIDSEDGHRAFLLTSTKTGGPTHYETRSGLMKSAFPKFGSREVDDSGDTNRRQELAYIITVEENRQLASAMVNRVWSMFFGYGFTSPIDDMGTHKAASHPDLLATLTEQFRLSGFDLKRLIRWIVLSDAYSLESRFADNEIDSPERGEVPLFSRMYVRSMSPEQVYDSMLVATQADQRPGFDWNRANQRRHEWIQQFLFAHGNEENTESNTFDGSITQALSMMNSRLTQEAVSTDRGTLLATIIGSRKSTTAQLKAICQATLSRDPSNAEQTAFRRLLRQAPTVQARRAILQDVLWAYLNSNEFILVH